MVLGAPSAVEGALPNGPVGPAGPARSSRAISRKGLYDKRRARGKALHGKRGARAHSAAAGSGVGSGSARTLVLYDSTGPFAWIGGTYATMTGNLVSHFGAWVAKPVSTYAAGEISQYTGVVYIGSTYDEQLPASFLADVRGGGKPVIWMYDNIWQLAASDPSFQADFGFTPSFFQDCSTCPNSTDVTRVTYKGQTLTRNKLNDAGIMDYSALDSARVQVLAQGQRDDGSTIPWAIRSGNLTYIGEIPFAYFSDGDRTLIFSDLLFDALAPSTPTRHRALVRLEDINPTNDPDQLRAVADYLHSQDVPFAFGVIPRYTDPNGVYNAGTPETVTLKQAPKVVAALKYMQSKGGVMVDHGWTHQYSNIANPYDAVTGDDTEFFRMTEDVDHRVHLEGPLPGDSASWAGDRVTKAAKDFSAVKLKLPAIFEFPHYAASAVDYAAIGQRFGARYERSLYPSGVLTGATPDYTRLTGQFFPYPVRDVYGQKVIPENLNAVAPEPFHSFPSRLPGDILADARRNLVVRDGFASFYYHPFLDLGYLRQTVEGIKALGYTFVSPNSV